MRRAWTRAVRRAGRRAMEERMEEEGRMDGREKSREEGKHEQKITYFSRRTTYSNRKIDIIDNNKWLIQYHFFMYPFIY